MDDEWREYHIHAEHCPGPFYMGWWLYIDPVCDGVPTADRSSKNPLGWWLGSWLKHDWMQEWVRTVAAAYGLADVPSATRYEQRVAKHIGQKCSQGLRVLIRGADLRDWQVPDWLLESEATRVSCWRYADSEDWAMLPLVRFDVGGIVQRELWVA